MQGARIRHSHAVEFFEREAKKNAESFEARTTTIFFQHTLFLFAVQLKVFAMELIRTAFSILSREFGIVA